MAIDLEALKRKLGSFKRNGGDRDAEIWKPKEGKTIIRIVPWVENPSNPFIELYFHYLGNKTYLSPLSYGNRDPIAEFADAIRNDQEKDPKERYAEARPFMPKLRTYVPVIVRGEEDKGVRFYSFGKTVTVDLLTFINDPDYGDITDPKTGRDIVVEYTPKEKSDTNFAKTKVMVKPNVSPLSTDPAQVKQWLTTQPDIKAMYPEPSYNELSAALQRYIDPDNSIIPAKAPENQSVVETVAKSSAPAAAPKKSVVEDFNSLFEEE